MKTRAMPLGDKNVIGENVARLRLERKLSQVDFITKIYLEGYAMNPTSYSKLEGQTRAANDKEIFAIARALNVPVDRLFEGVTLPPIEED